VEELIQRAIKPELVVLIPILNCIGAILKATPSVKNWTIPYILMAIGIALAVVYTLFAASDAYATAGAAVVSGAIQGFLCALMAVGGHQCVKQFAERNGK